MRDSEIESVQGRGYDNGGLSSSDGIGLRGQSLFESSDIPSDLVVQIGDVNFHLHKHPLICRSGRLNRIIHELPQEDRINICLHNLPGGPEVFEMAAKFCYGVEVYLTATNVSVLRCAAEYLEMTEDLEEGNLIFKTEAFLSYVVLSSWKDSIVVLKTCENLSPWVENLQIVRRCTDSIAQKAYANMKGIIRWSYQEKPGISAVSSPKCTELSISSSSESADAPCDWWFEDISFLRIDHFVRVITAVKVKSMRHELIGLAIMYYATKWLPRLIIKEISELAHANGSSSGTCNADMGLDMVAAGSKEDLLKLSSKDQRMIIESLISILPPQKDSVTCSFLLRLLRAANMVQVSSALITELEKRVGMQLDEAHLNHLLIPCYHKNETMYDVDLVQRLLEHYLMQEQGESESTSDMKIKNVASVVDSYLTEVARDRSLSLAKFQPLAEVLPASARTSDDGLYRAVDSYLKSHPLLNDHERKRLCRILDYQKLSLEACMHAAHNERLPVRFILQLIFAEQQKLSNAITNTKSSNQNQPSTSTRKSLFHETPQSFQEGWAAAKRDIRTLKAEIDNIKAKHLELQHEIQLLARKTDVVGVGKPKQSSYWTFGWMKLSMIGRKMQEDEKLDVFRDQQSKRSNRRWRYSVS